MSTKPRVLVGVDGSPSAQNALRWGAREAKARDTTLVAVMAWDLLSQLPVDGPASFDPGFDDDRARAELDRFIDDVLDPADAAGIERRVICDVPARALLDLAGERDLLVVGTRGRGGFKGLLLGSVSEQVLHHAAGPVVVVPEDRPQRGGRIVVGVDGSSLSVLALSWAVAEARLWGGTVEAVNVWTYPYAGALPFAPVCDPGDIEEGARAALDAAVARVNGDGPSVERVLLQGQPAHRLRDYAAEAGVLVVGSRGRGGFKGLLLGSVSGQCVRHAPCPTVVVRSQP